MSIQLDLFSKQELLGGFNINLKMPFQKGINMFALGNFLL